ncbi:MAG: UDP-N-acetylmuramoyl-L-alanyl-D-glutamate--2,6-diaminopimelate ligase [Salinisphaeraceae bacterium]|nr:UDP-N-acetylmuramoyl-L-alanyl-D-glutamate--2,6-diaminopimelate ligase [Salinisphaeraceae bacterium]
MNAPMAWREPSRPAQPLAALLQCELPENLASLTVNGVNQDSRLIQPGELFLACEGETVHGLEFLSQAQSNGAAAVAWEPVDGIEAPQGLPAVAVEQLARQTGEIAARFYGQPAQNMFVVGITGTDGKTSCAWILAQALSLLNQRCGYLGTLGYGFVGQMDTASHTTPDAVRLQYWLAKLAANDASAVALEVSSHALAQGRARGVDFDMAILTNIGRDHLDYHGDMASYIAAKRRLFETPGLRAAILNQDDAVGAQWLVDLPQAVTAVAYGVAEQPHAAADRYVIATQLQSHAHGLSIDIDSSWGQGRLETALLGRFNAHNLLACLAVLLEQGIELQAALQALGQVPTVPGRMQAVPAREGQPLVVVDYAHTPQALGQAVKALRDHCEGQLFCVFGCGGDRDRGKRPLMAEAASQADVVVVTDDNPRSEDPASIVVEITAGMPADANFRVEHDRAEAIAQAISQAGAGDVVLIAGKGHEDYQIIGTERRDFSDFAVAQACLKTGAAHG